MSGVKGSQAPDGFVDYVDYVVLFTEGEVDERCALAAVIEGRIGDRNHADTFGKGMAEGQTVCCRRRQPRPAGGCRR